MRSHRARVYYRSYLPGEPHPTVRAAALEIDDRWRDEASMDYAHDSHSKWEHLTVSETTETAVLAALQRNHPKRVLFLDKISWLEEE